MLNEAVSIGHRFPILRNVIQPKMAYNSRVLRKLAFALFALSLAASAQTAGQLTPKVVAKADAQQTYALYLPTHFDASRRWPVLYLFDPGARGAEAAERFRAA